MVAGAQRGADVRRLAELGQVLPGAEATASTGEHDCAHVGVARLLDRIQQEPLRLGIERVQDVGPVQRDRLDGAVAGDFDLRHDADSIRVASVGAWD